MGENSILVKKVMTKEVITVTAGISLKGLLEKFKGFHSFPVIPVVDKEGILKGVISFKNLVEIFQTKGMGLIKGIPFLEKEGMDIFDLEIEEGAGLLFIAQDIMDAKFIYVDEEATIEQAYTAMKINSTDILPVIDKEGRFAGVIGIFDILLAIFEKKGLVK